jgi:hypothetical protein
MGNKVTTTYAHWPSSSLSTQNKRSASQYYDVLVENQTLRECSSSPGGIPTPLLTLIASYTAHIPMIIAIFYERQTADFGIYLLPTFGDVHKNKNHVGDAIHEASDQSSTSSSSSYRVVTKCPSDAAGELLRMNQSDTFLLVSSDATSYYRFRVSDASWCHYIEQPPCSAVSVSWSTTASIWCYDRLLSCDALKKEWFTTHEPLRLWLHPTKDGKRDDDQYRKLTDKWSLHDPPPSMQTNQGFKSFFHIYHVNDGRIFMWPIYDRNHQNGYSFDHRTGQWSNNISPLKFHHVSLFTAARPRKFRVNENPKPSRVIGWWAFGSFQKWYLIPATSSCSRYSGILL